MNSRIISIVVTISLLQIHSISGADVQNGDDHDGETEVHYAVLFPWFAQIIGVVIFYAGTRYFRALPYTAVMFFIGVLMGIADVKLLKDNQLIES
jgi:hypothetical protein